MAGAANPGTFPLPDVPTSHEIHEPRPLETPEANDVRDLAVGLDQRVWVATRGGVFVTGPERAGWRAVEPAGALTPAFSVATDTEAAWVGSWTGLHRVTEAGAERIANVDGPVVAVAASPDGVMTAGPGGFFWLRGGRAERLEIAATRYVNRVAVSRDGSGWLATKMGLFHARPGVGGYLPFPFERVGADVRDVVFTASEEAWAAALGGIQVYCDGRFRRQVTPADGLPSADVSCLAVGPDGRVWAGTALGLARQERSGWGVRRGRRWLLNDMVRDIAFDRSGAAWVATAGGVSVLRQTNLTLVAKAGRFHEVLEARHVRPPGIVEKCRLRVPGDLATWAPTDDDNDGGYTAVYLAMESYRFAAKRDPAALAGARRALAALEFLQRVTGTPGFVARTVVPAGWTDVHDPNESVSDAVWAEAEATDPRNKRVPERWRLSADGRWRWKGDTSSDEITAHFFGYYVFHELAADAADRLRVREQVCRIVDHLIEHGFELTDTDGRHTRWGVWAPERLNDDPDWAMERGINSVEVLSFLKLAHHVSGDPRYDGHYRDLIQRHHYDRNVREAPNLNPAWRTHIDAELLAFAYPALLELEREPRLRRVYQASFERWYAAVRGDRTAFFDVLHWRHGGRRRPDAAGVIATLRETPLDLIGWTMDNTPREDLRLRRIPELEAWQTDRRLPPPEIMFSRTDQNPWLARQGDEGATESDGVFWLLPYWMARWQGIVGTP